MKIFNNNFILLLLLLIIVVTPLIILPNAEYGGADGQAKGIITEVSPDYQPWFSSIWEPPSGEIESLLFALQAVIGASFIAYFIGYLKGKRKNATN